jgi:sugar lactone lactonase YvrE
MATGAYFTAVDTTGNLYISETDGNRIRKVTPDGNITMVVGARPSGFSGDGGPASNAQIRTPAGIAVDESGALYFSDSSNSRIRKIAPDGIITTVAGNGDSGNNGDGGPATAAAIGFPAGLTIDRSGNLYFTVGGYNRIRKVSTDGKISTIAGTGPYGNGSFSGDRGPALSATFAGPAGIAVDVAGNVYVADSGNQRVRKIDTNGIVTTVAGDGNSGFAGDGGPAGVSRLSGPSDVALDAQGNLYIAEYGNHIIRFVRGLDLPPLNTYSITATGAASLSTPGTSIATAVGYARVQPTNATSTPAGVAIFGLRQNNILISETSVPASALVKSGRLYAQLGGTVNTGVAIANVNDMPAEISFYFTGPNGDSGLRSVTIGPRSQISAFLNESPFGGIAPFEGSFTFSSSLPVGVTALRGLINERSEFLMTTLPVVELSMPALAAPVSIPHFAAGGGWTTQIVLVNPTDLPMAGTLEFRDQAGSPAVVTIGGLTNDSFTYSLPPRGGQRFVTADVGATTATGSVRLLRAGGGTAPAASVVFSFRRNGVTVTESGVPVIPASSSFTLYAEMSGNFAGGAPGSIQTGIAIHNPSDAATVVTLGSETLVVPARGQVAKFLHEIPGFSIVPPFQGAIRISSLSPVSIVGLRGRYNERGDFLVTTLPALGNATGSTGEVVFPHFAEGGGYTTQFVLIGSPSSQSASGVVTLFSQNGDPLTLTLK